jgi:voltage-gated potassium channel
MSGTERVRKLLGDKSALNHGARYDRWVAATTKPLDILAVVFLVDFALSRLTPEGPPWWQPTLTVISLLIWAAFAVDYFVRLGLSTDRWSFIRTHKLDLLMVLLPMLRLLRVILLLRKSFSTISTERIASSLISIVVGVVVVGAFLEWRVEYNAPGANITTMGTALWWAVVTTTTVGYGDTYPVTTMGRLIGSVIMMVGIGLIGTVSATVAAWFVNHKRTRQDAAQAKALADQSEQATAPASATADTDSLIGTLASLSTQIEVLSRQQRELRATIERLVDQRGRP